MKSIHLVTDHPAEQDAAVMIARMKGRARAEAPDAAETQAFLDRLRGVTFRSYRSNLAAPDLTPLPRGYRNVRVRDARDGATLGSIWWIGSGDGPRRAGAAFLTTTERPTARGVIAILLGMAVEEVTEWRSTRAIPGAEPGLLDLEVDIDTRPRELLVDGSALPPHLVEFMRSKAPRRAPSPPGC